MELKESKPEAISKLGRTPVGRLLDFSTAVVLCLLIAIGGLTAIMMAQELDFVDAVEVAGPAEQARYCLEMISREVQESVDFDIQGQAVGMPPASTVDALLLTSARGYYNPTTTEPGIKSAVYDDGLLVPRSITLFYLNMTSGGISQLVRHQLYYSEDLNAYTPPFSLSPDPYVGPYIVIFDDNGTQINIHRTTGSVAEALSSKSPMILVNHMNSFDLVDIGQGSIEVRAAVQVADRFGRPKTLYLQNFSQPN